MDDIAPMDIAESGGKEILGRVQAARMNGRFNCFVHSIILM